MPVPAHADMQTVHASIELLQRLTDLFQQRRVQLARSVGLTEREWRLLEGISTEHFMPSMFARSHDQSPAAVSKVLRQLLDKELVQVSVSAADGRQRDYELSARGRRVMKALRAERQQAIDAIWTRLDRDELEVFGAVGRQLVERIERYAEAERERSDPRERGTAAALPRGRERRVTLPTTKQEA